MVNPFLHLQADVTWKDSANKAVTTVMWNNDKTETINVYIDQVTEHAYFMFQMGDFEWSNTTDVNSYQLKYGINDNWPIVDFFALNVEDPNELKAYVNASDNANVADINGFEMWFKQYGEKKQSNWIPSSYGLPTNTGTRIYFVETWINGLWSATLDLTKVKTLVFDSKTEIGGWEGHLYNLRVEIFKDSFWTWHIWANYDNSGNDQESRIRNESFELKLIEELGVTDVKIWFEQNGSWNDKNSELITWEKIGIISIDHSKWNGNTWGYFSN